MKTSLWLTELPSKSKPFFIPTANSVLSDKDYVAFLESLDEEIEPLPSIEAHLEEIESRKESEFILFSPIQFSFLG
jgi:peptidase E